MARSNRTAGVFAAFWIVMRRGLCALAVALAAGACSHDAAPTQPTPAPSPTPAPAPVVVVHDTLNPEGSRANTLIFGSTDYIDSLGRQSRGSHVYDDFTSTQNAEVRSVSWDAAYCDGRYQVPLAIPDPVAKSFRVTLAGDSGFNAPDIETVPGSRPLYDLLLDAAQVRQEHQFDILENNDWSCGGNTQRPYAFYRYTVTLPTAFSVVAGRKYWLSVVADMGSTQIGWGWRPIATGRSWVSVYSATYGWDMAFRLASQ